MSSFENLRVVDNFYQTSLFFPMPTVVISTLCEDGMTTCGPYSLVQPYYVAGKGYYAMLLSCRNSSNTAQNILRNGKCALNFIDDNPKTFKECVKLSWPGDKPEEKMPKCNFKLEKSQIEEETGENPVLLLDDVLSELDRERQNYLINSLEDTQVFITTTEISDEVEESLGNIKYFQIENGQIISEEIKGTEI